MNAAGADACTVSLSGAAGWRGVQVILSSSSSLVAVPASVTVRRGGTTAGFTATVSAFSGTQTVLLTATAGGASTTFGLQLSGGTPAITLQSTSIAFGSVALNTPATQSLALTSSGTAPLTISAASMAGSGFSGSGLAFPVTLSPGQSASLQLQFDPTAAGAAAGSLTISSNAANTPTATIPLSGTGTAGSYEVALTWDAPANSTDPVAGYNIYRAPSGSSSYQLLNSSADAQAAYTDTTVQSGSNYSYYIVSVDASGVESGPSNTILMSIP